MTRIIMALAAGIATTGSLVAVHAATLAPHHAAHQMAAATPAPRLITATPDGKPILLKRMVVTESALPEA